MKHRAILFFCSFALVAAGAGLGRLRFHKVPTDFGQPSSLQVVWTSETGNNNNLGTFNSPITSARAFSFTNVYIAFHDGCYAELAPEMCVTNSAATPAFTNSPVADYPLDWVVILKP